MKTWIKRTLIGFTTATVALFGLTACGSHGDHSRGWSEERVAQVRGKAIDKISNKLELTAEQKVKLGVVADEFIASRKAFKGSSADPRSEVLTLIEGNKFDRNKAQTLLDQKTQVVQGSGPKMLSAFGDFYDSLTPEQQKQVRERLNKRGHGWMSRG